MEQELDQHYNWLQKSPFIVAILQYILKNEPLPSEIRPSIQINQNEIDLSMQNVLDSVNVLYQKLHNNDNITERDFYQREIPRLIRIQEHVQAANKSDNYFQTIYHLEMANVFTLNLEEYRRRNDKIEQWYEKLESMHIVIENEEDEEFDVLIQLKEILSEFQSTQLENLQMKKFIHANILEQFEQFDDALELYNELILETQNSSEDLIQNYLLLSSYQNRAEIKSEINSTEALNDLNFIVEYPKKKKIDLHFALLSRADLYSDQFVEKALEDYKQCQELNPNDPVIYNNRALLYQEKKKDFKLALQDLNKAIQLDPNDYQFYLNRAFLYQEYLHDKKKATVDKKKALKLKPDLELDF